MEFSRFEEQSFLTTVLITNLTDKEFGTGFLVNKPIKDDSKKTKYLLFSNKHVFWGQKDKDNPTAKKRISIVLHKKEPDGSYKISAVNTFVIDIDRGQSGSGYYEHPDKNIDIACINISNAANMDIILNIRTIDVDNFFNFDKNSLVAGTQVLFVGYPTGFYDKKNFLPVMRTGSIASIPSIDFNGNRQILLDAQIFPGSSGSPVFVGVGGKYKLLGIVSDGVRKGLDFIEVLKTTEVKQEKTQLPVEWIGLGLLFTNETIKEVYDLV